MKKIKATCQIIDIKTDGVISERVIGEFNTRDEAEFTAFRARLEGESVCLYNLSVEEEEFLSPLEMAEQEAEWEEMNRF